MGFKKQGTPSPVTKIIDPADPNAKKGFTEPVKIRIPPQAQPK